MERSVIRFRESARSFEKGKIMYKDSFYVEESNGYRVSVRPSYVETESKPNENYYCFAYHVIIENLAGTDAQLARRHWIITDGEGRREEVEGPGVVGDHPQFTKGSRYQYTSACPLPTPTGNMRGYYFLRDLEGKEVKIKIPLFFLRPN